MVLEELVTKHLCSVSSGGPQGSVPGASAVESLLW